MNIIDKATNHFRNKLNVEMRVVSVPEWECDIYVKDVTSLREESKLVELTQQGKTVEALVETLIMKARDKTGNKLFTSADKPVFMNEIDPAIIIRIVGEINNVRPLTLDETEKN